MNHGERAGHSFFRLVAAVIVAMALVAALVVGIAYLKWGRGPSVAKNSVLVQTVGGPMLEYPAGGYASGMLGGGELTLQGVLDNLNKAAVDKRVIGVVLDIGNPGAGYAMLQEMRSAVAKVRKAGKPVWAWTDGLDLKSLYLASACDSLFLMPTGNAALTGMYGERMYVKSALDKLGVRPQVARIESYKSAAEMVMRTDMSPQARKMSLWMMNDIFPRVLAETAAGLGVERSVLDQAMEKTVFSAREAVTMGLASGLRYWDEMKDALPRPRGKDEPVLLAGSRYTRIQPAKVGLKGKKKIAVVHAEGMIGGAASGRNPLFGVTMGYRTVNRALRRALDDDDVAAVVFRVNSPGGESNTSDRIGRMVEVVNRKKPVIVSMVDVAASGGYSISYRARALVADANTITGSIGSITGKFNLRGLYNRLGITKDGVGVGPFPDFYSDYRDWTREEFAKIKANHWDGYEQWVKDIAKHRGMTAAEVDSLGRGRVWTGKQALANGLVDTLGTLDAAVALAKKEAGLQPEEKVTLVHYPKPRGLLARILGMPVSAVPGRLLGAWVREQVTQADRFQRSDLQLLEVPVP